MPFGRGQFISPDTLVPDATNLMDFNRYAYGLGNPVKFSDPSGHFSEEQLVGWYGKNWCNRFTPAWAKLLLDNPNSQTLGAQLGDLVVMGSGNQMTQGVLVLNTAGNLALWNVASKTATEVAALGNTTPENLGLYRIARGDSGATSPRFGYLMGETQYLPGENGSGVGPFTMLQLGQYSTGQALPDTLALAGDWFMGQGGAGYFVDNQMTFQGFGCGYECTLGASGTGMGALDLVRSYLQGQAPTRMGLWGTIFSVASTIYGTAMYRPVYQLMPCPAIGPNYCQASH